jgi:Arc/MetJ-type ribon-helix-helix transcriptional regulator
MSLFRVRSRPYQWEVTKEHSMVTVHDLVEARLYESEDAVIHDALRHLLRAWPDLRINLAVHR